MSTYSDVQNTRALFVSAVGTSTSGYLGNPLLNPPLKTFTTILATMAQELVDAGGESATTEFLDTQVAEYTKLVSYVEKLTEQNRDEQIHSNGVDFYFTGTGDVTKTFGSSHTGDMTDRILEMTREPEASVEVTGITTTATTTIATYTSMTGYEMIPSDKGMMCIDLYAEKTDGDGDVYVYFHAVLVSSTGNSTYDNLYDTTISTTTKKNYATLIPAVKGLYKIYAKAPEASIPTTNSTSNRLKLTIYAFTSSGTANLKWYTNGSSFSKFRSTIVPTNNNFEFIALRANSSSYYSHGRSWYNVGGHSCTANNGFTAFTTTSAGGSSTVTIPKTGLYKLHFNFSWVNTFYHADCYREFRILRNSSVLTTVNQECRHARDFYNCSIIHIAELTKGDIIYVQTYVWSATYFDVSWRMANPFDQWFIERIR